MYRKHAKTAQDDLAFFESPEKQKIMLRRGFDLCDCGQYKLADNDMCAICEGEL